MSAVQKGIPKGSINDDEDSDLIDERAPLLISVNDSLDLEKAKQVDDSGKQSSFATILALANTMLGSSLLAIPWGFTQSGFITGLIVILVVGLTCYYTAYLVVKNGSGKEDFSDVCKETLGRGGYFLSILTSVLILLGAATAYDIIMSQSIWKFVEGWDYFITHQDPSSTFASIWTEKTAPLVVIAILFPFTNLKNITALVKLNTVGVFTILFLLVYIPFISFYGRMDHINMKEQKEFDSRFFYLAGIMTLAFFIHNICPSILKNNRNQKNNARDLFFAFLLVAFCYSFIGGTAYLSYSRDPGGIPQDFLESLPVTDVVPMISRGLVALQLFSVYPLILYIIRIQIFGMFYSTPNWPGFIPVILMNVAIAAFTTLFAIFYPQIGTVLRFTGAFCGFVYVFLLPIGVHWVFQKRNNQLTVFSLVFHGFLLLVGLGSIVAQLL